MGVNTTNWYIKSLPKLKKWLKKLKECRSWSWQFCKFEVMIVLQIKVKTFSLNSAELKASLAHTLLRHRLTSSFFNFWTWSDAPSMSRIFKVSPLYKLNNKVRMMTELQTIKYDPNDSFYTLTCTLTCLIDVYLSINWSLILINSMRTHIHE